MPPDPERFLGLSAGTLTRSVGWSLAQRIAPYGVMPGAYAVIAWLMQLKDSTQGELSRLIGIEQPTMAITLRRMERDGLIERHPDPSHGRRSRVKLSSRGKEISQVMTVAAREVESVAYQGVSEAEVAQFFRLIELMTENLSGERRKRSG